MVAADEAAAGLVALLAVVGHVDHDGVLVLKLAHDGVHHRVVVDHGVVVVGHDAALAVVEVGAALLVGLGAKHAAVVGAAGAVVHVLAYEVEDDEVVGRVALELDLAVTHQAVVVGDEPVVEAVGLVVAQAKLGLAERGVVEEEAAREVVNGILRLGQKLVGEERHAVAGLAEQLGKQGVVAPLALLAHHMHREDVLKHEARQVPAGHHVAKLREPSARLAAHLARRGLQAVAILLRVVLGVALANDEHNRGGAKRAAVHRHPLGGLYALGYLLVGQAVAVPTEHEAIDGQIHVATIFLGQQVLHGAHAMGGHQLGHAYLVVVALRHAHA